MNRFKLLAGIALALITSAGAATAGNQVTTTFSMQVAATTTDCSNSPGPQITFGGQFALAGLNATLIFTNNEKGTHTYTDGVHVDASVLTAGQTVVIPKQPSRG